MNHQRLHVAMIIQAYLPLLGGAERQLAALAPLLSDQGVDISVITRRYPELKEFEWVDGVPVYRLPVPGPKPVASLAFSLAALPLLQRLRPDVIHAHELLSPTTTAVTAKRRFHIPVVAKVLRGGVLGDLAKLERKPFGRKRMQTFKQQVDRFIVISQEIDAELASGGWLRRSGFLFPTGWIRSALRLCRRQRKRGCARNWGWGREKRPFTPAVLSRKNVWINSSGCGRRCAKFTPAPNYWY